MARRQQAIPAYAESKLFDYVQAGVASLPVRNAMQAGSAHTLPTRGVYLAASAGDFPLLSHADIRSSGKSEVHLV